MSMTPGQAASVRAQTTRPVRRVIAGAQSSSRPAWPSSRWVIGEPARWCFPKPSDASTSSCGMARPQSQRCEYVVLRDGKAAAPRVRRPSWRQSRIFGCEYVILRDGKAAIPALRVRHPSRWQGRSAASTPSFVAAKPHITDASTSSTLTARPHRPPLRVRRSRGWQGRTGGCLGKSALTTP